MKKPLSDPMIPIPSRIQRVRKETHDTFTFDLALTNGCNTFPFAPGQFNMLYIFGKGEVPISLSGNPDEPKTIKHTVRSAGIVTKGMSMLKQGDTLGIRGPFGNSWPMEEVEGRDVVIVAGGIGLAPLRPVLYKIISEREKYGKVALLYGARAPGDLLYKRELERWRTESAIEVMITVDTASKDWSGKVGVVTTLIPNAPFDPNHTISMICGPEVMMRFTIKTLRDCGIEKEHIYLSMERNMKCGIGLCGHCQLGSAFVCKDGPVFRFDRIQHIFGKREI